MDTEELSVSAEALDKAKQEAIAALAEEQQEELKKESWFTKAVKWFYGTIVKPLCQIVFTGVKETVTFILNNPENQNLAKLAIIAAAKAGLKGNAAWLAAMAVFKAGKICIGVGKYIACSDLDTNVRETLLQLVYTCLRNSEAGQKLLNGKAVETRGCLPELPA